MISLFRRLNFSERQERLLVTLLILPLVTFYRFFEGIPEFANYQFEGKIALAVTGGAVLLVWLIIKWCWDREILQSKINYLILIIFGYVLIKLALSGTSSLSVEYSLLLIGYCLTFYLLADLRRNDLIWESIISALLIVTGLSLFYLAKDLIRWFVYYHEAFPSDIRSVLHWYKFLPRFSGSYGPNVQAVNLLLIIPLGLYRTVKSEKTLGAIVHGSYVVLCAAALLLTKSRGGILGAGAVFGLFGLFLWSRILPWQRNRAIFVLGIVAGIGLIATGIGFVFISRGGLESVVPQARIDAWRITMRMIAAKPWLGIDLGTYGQEFINQRMGHETTIIHLHPHNEVLNAAVYLGLSGAALTLVSLAAFGKLGVQMLRRLEIKRLGNFALIGLIGYAVHGMVDSFINVFQVGALVLFLAVSLIGFRDRKIAYREDAYRMVWLTAMAVLVGAGALFQIWRLAPYEKARQAAAVGDIDSAAAWIDTALARDQENAYYHHTKAVLLGRKAVVEQVALDQAVSQFARSTAYYPGWAPDRYNYALLLSAQGQHGKALQELKAAISKFPDIAFYHCAAAEELEAVGWDHEAVQYYGSCLALSPGSRNLPYWGKSQVRQEHFTQIRSRAETYLADQDNASDNYRLRFYHHLGTQAQYDSFVERLPDSTALTNQQLAYRGSAHLEEGNWSSAEKVFLEMLESYPRSKAAWDGLAESYLGSGQEDKFEQAAKISLALGGSSRTFTLVGLHHEQVSRPEEAIDAYQLAMIYFTYPHRERKFATWTARRYPFPITWIGELPSLYSEYGYQLALERYSKLVANKSCQEQMRLHRQIIWNTANPSVISQLVDRSSSTDCD